MTQGATARRLRRAMCFRRHQLRRLEKTIRREDERHGGFRRQREQLLTLTQEIILRTDPAFYSAEITRWRQAFTTLSSEALQQHVANLSPETVIKKLGRACQHVHELACNEPEEIGQLLRAATAHVETLKRLAGGRSDSYKANVQEAKRLEAEIANLCTQSRTAEDNRNKAVQTIRRFQKERVIIQ
jgi:hypothetical protein